ncbi:MAG: hypothetical protein GXO84_09320 [Chlorobi bacterium]|jgi:hypothetical protein|nr:hypothetical protein [Chlorobiota bacterium]
MEELNNNKKQISRRKILPILGGGLLIPLFGFGNVISEKSTESSNEEYKILLRKDGTTVKVKASTLKNSKAVKKNISNNSFYNWLKNKF